MSMALVALGIILLVTTPKAVKLSAYIDIGGCGCPISLTVCHTGATNFALMYNAPNSDSTADDITALITCMVLWIVSLLAGNVVLLDMKKCPPALLLVCGSLKYEAMLSTANIMLLT